MSNLYVKTAKLHLTITVLTAILSSFSLSVIPFIPKMENEKTSVISYVIAAIFWVGLILTLITSYLTKRMLSRVREKMIAKGHLNGNSLPGVISFSLQGKNIFLYALTVLGGILVITDIIYNYVPEMMMFPILSLTVLSFELHCILDGRNYKVYKLIKESVNDETISKV